MNILNIVFATCVTKMQRVGITNTVQIIAYYIFIYILFILLIDAKKGEKEINKKVLNFGLMLYEQGKFNSDKAYLAQYEIDNYRQHLVNEVLHSKRKDVINHELENQRGYYV